MKDNLKNKFYYATILYFENDGIDLFSKRN